ncbi:putative tRNA sulfurtransferase [Thermus thermophilus]|uniref:tRNA uracil 4-sulfurtransferase ThiI n=1 Tax=Thermus thermophilus TaxID=274 RepID=UPI0011642FF1|nr:tRNA uracil 4-sulfurtransferase ThiI [Thermus thermophilus]BBL94332.1 putative tRNA sulfurtransferase [Thermus thermophilus]BCP98929.1 putative tRNA sulfurtransferase [Thermus thermophilus]BCQ01260.1 putative tRNA sulfurtransferase [Thermus thermophilus]
METLLLVQLFHELALKGKNRPFFLKRAKAHVRRALKGLGVALEGEWPMALLFRLPEEAWPEAKARLQDTLGVERFARVHRTPPDLEALKAALEKALEGQAFGSFRITAKRTDKAFPLTSPEIERALGAFVKGKTGAPVRLKGAEREFVVRVLPGAALLEVERHPGPGGLPPGVSGRVVALLSGGIDSPVAAYRLMRRGAEVVLVHFHPFPLLSGASREKAKALAERLARFQHRLRLHLVPFSEVQRHIIVEAPTAYRVVLYRRYMLRIAEAIAREEGALALCTGDSLGQVASQTLENLHAVNQAATLPVFRPLIGWDKEEIVAEAQRIGTYATSILPDEECCTLFAPKHPVTRARLEVVLETEARLPTEELLALALKEREVLTYTWPGKPLPEEPEGAFIMEHGPA